MAAAQINLIERELIVGERCSRRPAATVGVTTVAAAGVGRGQELVLPPASRARPTGRSARAVQARRSAAAPRDR